MDDVPAVVLVHGLWMPGWEMTLLGRRLAAAGFRPHSFHYPSMLSDADENARRLASFCARLQVRELNFVGHSLGGLVIRKLFARAAVPTGRVVTLGTPHLGSQRARWLNGLAAGRMLLGASFDGALSGRLPPWDGSRQLGVIAGDRSVAFSNVLHRLEGPNDGVVLVGETRLPGLTDHVLLPVSHTGMLFSRIVALQTIHFLRTGRFDRTQ